MVVCRAEEEFFVEGLERSIAVEARRRAPATLSGLLIGGIIGALLDGPRGALIGGILGGFLGCDLDKERGRK
jgi:uncharacterized protein YcfJ